MISSGKCGQILRPWVRLVAASSAASNVGNATNHRPRSTLSKRKPLKVYYPKHSTSQDKDPTRDVYLGGPQPELDEVLRDAVADKRRKQPSKQRSSSYVVSEEQEEQSHAKFFRSKGLPKIVPIHAWDKDNKNLRALRNHFLRKTPKVQPQLPENEFYEQHQADEDEAGPDEKSTRTPEGPSHQAPMDDGIVVLESKRLIREAMERGIDPQIFVTSRINLLKEFPLEKIGNKQSVRLFWLPHQTISGWSDLTTSPGYMASFKKSDLVRFASRPGRRHLGMTVILDNIRNPDNLGGVIRLAAAVGASQVLATSGCVDAWQPKVLRAAAGAHFNLPIKTKIQWSEVEQHLPESNGRQVVLCDSSSDQDSTVYEDDRAKLSQLVSQASGYKCADPKTGLKYDYSFNEGDLVEQFSRVSLPETPLSQFKRMESDESHAVIVIGGETHGVSKRAHKFALENSGCRAYIPLFNDMDSLNSLSAASILLHHCQTQWIELGSR